MRKIFFLSIFAFNLLGASIGYAAEQDTVDVEIPAIESLTDLAEDDYPIKLDPAKLGATNTVADAFQLSQIPTVELKNYNTQKLIKVAISYPGAFMFTAFNQPQQGIDIFVKQSNMVKELYSRPDAAKQLLKFYSRFDHKLSISNLPENKKERVIIKLVNLTNLLGQYEILDKLNESQLKKVINITYANLLDMSKPEQEKYFDFIAKGSTALLLWRSASKSNISIINNLSQEAHNYLKTGEPYNELINSEVVMAAQSIVY